jgi:Domain of unknown function (DUF6901)
MNSIIIQYCFRLPDNSSENFKLQLNPHSLELIGNIPQCLPEWSKLNFHQCQHCPLDPVINPYCPLAANIVNIVKRFDGLISYDKIRVDVITQERRISQHTTAQKAISSMMGLVIATCGCPHTGFFKAMGRFHLPLANNEETIFRATSMYLLAQYFLKMEGRYADLELEGLTKIYHNMQIVNVAIAKRLRSTSMSDSSINAIVILDNYAKSLPYAIEKSLGDLRHLFLPFLT